MFIKFTPSMLAAAGLGVVAVPASAVTTTQTFNVNPVTSNWNPEDGGTDTSSPVDIVIGGNATAQFTFGANPYYGEDGGSGQIKSVDFAANGTSGVGEYAFLFDDFKNPLSIDPNAAYDKSSDRIGKFGPQQLRLRFDVNGQTQYGIANFEGFTLNSIEYQAADAVSAIPEPAVWAQMIVGFGLAGTAMRRSRRRVRAVAA